NLRHLLESQPERMVTVHWSPREGSLFLVAIQTEALDRTGLLSDVTRAISDQHVNILSASVTPPGTGARAARSPSEWAIPSPWATCSGPSVRSTASTTSTASRTELARGITTGPC